MIISCRLSLKIREEFVVLQQAVSNKVLKNAIFLSCLLYVDTTLVGLLSVVPFYS